LSKSLEVQQNTSLEIPNPLQHEEATESTHHKNVIDSKRKKIFILPIPPLEESEEPERPVEVATIKAKPKVYGGFSTSPIEIKPLPSWCNVKPKRPNLEPLHPKKEENKQDDSRFREGNKNTNKLIKMREDENEEEIQHLQYEIMKFMVKEEAKKLAAKKKHEEWLKAEEERQKTRSILHHRIVLL
jgi:hypothetical protein